ncbi:cryptochrome/photolyase family protein [Roseivirga sp.]|uniref:cryptochrome/photolyase family protein n=1 Tax=Roseivirga sp. TaxID=1964215 RepID=UPI003B51DBA6
MKKMRLILGDQLNHQHSWFNEKSDNTLYVLMEMRQELEYVTHHIQKVVAFFLAMRSFADHLKRNGHQIIYLQLDAEENNQSLTENLQWLIQRHGIEKFEYQLPDEYRLDEQLKEFCETLDISTEAFDTEHFLTDRSTLADFFKGKKQLLMESFYRMMRKQHEVLMDNGEPVGGKWNYDHENRKKMPEDTYVPQPKAYERDVQEIVDLLHAFEVATIGNIDAQSFIWPVTREEGLDLLNFFLEDCLPYFGAYQDAMTTKGWSLFHSRLSFVMNVKLLSPEEVIRKTEAHWQKNKDIPLSAVEGFIRQILGWREYMRGIYWKYMPDYREENFFNNNRNLPSWYWTGETKMKCLSHAVRQSLDHAYAHHIQRLMVTGNFALLAGVHPDEVDAWYLGIYIDALEWVEITNTRGMSQFADGGIVATKPYVSSANYMHKMSHYCSQCHYDYKKKTGDKACPFNSLYWDFLERNRKELDGNPRMGMIYRVWDKNSTEKKNQIIEQAAKYLDKINEL